jgi:hypothetical protein
LRLARLGATARLEELRREIVSLETLLGEDAPRVKRRVTRRKASKASKASKAATVATAAAAEAPAPNKTATAWSPAARRAVSLRMKKYWAARRQAKKR